ncbi:MAG: V-type ATP synthase subunit D [Theionarchaea archaeon]|nr:V-type ATP synthase subunit D [Theionarchaea archaeon]MBU6999762.1 V-type ATP synthase subunit D [Theionarchaea archaeon]MBU7020183.1 V-type ATP synthase subunit D [Theionarchaea archaeon]MBU7033700.1 V-type ATP synthase subunit D [Theionarchaea archaeon]MBU7039989.1 V-type ATP synthase subunit D [Theionarchaea archaeon]
MAKVNATRMELLKLKKRVKLAKRGHKLLKDKRDELMKQFLSLIHRNRELREDIEREIAVVYRTFMSARSLMSPEMLEEALMLPKARLNVEIGTRLIMSVQVPQIAMSQEGEGILSYGLYNVPSELDESLDALQTLMPKLIQLAEMEKSLELLAAEIEKTRRRVNALEYVLIPELESTAGFIEMKLDEMERSALTTLMSITGKLRE